MYIDFTNIFLLVVLDISFIIALMAKTGGIRLLGTITTFLLLVTTTEINVIFSLLILGFGIAHSFTDGFRNQGRYSYVLIVFGLCAVLVSSPLVLAEHNPAHTTSTNASNSSGGVGGGLPSVVERVELVEEVLEITNQPEIDVKGTDYVPGDIGKMQVYLTQGNNPITNATCLISALYPNMTFFIQQQLMLEANKTDFERLYFYGFVVPNVSGVYPVNA